MGSDPHDKCAMVSSDDDDDGVFGRKIYSSCDCAVRHNSAYRCAVCGICYFKALDIYNADLVEAHPAELVEASKRFGGLTFGSIFWFCSDCKSMLAESSCILEFLRKSKDEAVKERSNQLVKADHKSSFSDMQRDEMLQNLSKDSEVVHKQLSSIQEMLKTLSEKNVVPVAVSPPRKSAKTAIVGWDMDGNAVVDFASNPVPSVFTDNNANCKQASPSFASAVKINLKKKTDASPNLFKRLHDNRKLMPTFITKKKLDGSVDILLNSFDDADKAKSVLDDKLNDATISKPLPKKFKRFTLVGLEFQMSVDEVTDAIMEENKYWLDLIKSDDNMLSLKNDPLSVIKVLNVSKCRNVSCYKVVIEMSSNMCATVGNRKLSIGHTNCYSYEFVNHRRCYKCQEHGHISRNCTNPVACSRCSLEHSSAECTSNNFKCVNCVRNRRDDVNHPSYSVKCPYNTT